MSPWLAGGLVVLFFVGFGAIAAAARRPHTLVELADSKAKLARGQLPPGLLSELGDIARSSPDSTGQLEIHGQQDSLRLVTRGLDEAVEQRLRNVVLLQRSRIRRS